MAPFLILVLTSFLSCATHSGPIFHTVSYAVTCGIPLMAAVSIYSLEGLAGMGGRLVFGLLGDRFGAARPEERDQFPDTGTGEGDTHRHSRGD